jgi:tryptophanyl-tRNA synthetase
VNLGLTQSGCNALEPPRKSDQPGYIEEIIQTGTLRAREETKETLYAMKKAMGFTGVWNRIRRKAEKYGKKQPEREA